MQRLLALLSCVSLLLLQACHEDPYLTVSPESLSFTQEGGSQTVQVSANYAWTASITGSGFKISPSSGEGAGSVTVTASASSSPDDITGSISFRSEGLTASVAIKQEAKSVIEVGSISKIPAEGGTVTVDIRYNTDFSVAIESAAQSWISFVQTKALKSGQLVFSFKANDEYEERTGNATVKDKAGKVADVTLTFKQEAKEWVDVTSVKLDRTSAEIEIGETMALEVTVEPENASDKTVTWSSDKPEVATADENGRVTGVAEGTATITAKAGNKSAACIITVTPDEENRIKAALMRIYDAMNGPQWGIQNKWDPAKDLNSWQGVRWNDETHELKLDFNDQFKLKGEFPDCFAALTPCVHFWVQNQPGLTGTLPSSFNKLTRLTSLVIESTSMARLPDLFAGLPLGFVSISSNESMTGQLPETLGSSDGLMADTKIEGIYDAELVVSGNGFTGTIPESWLRLGPRLTMYAHKLDGQIPDYFYSAHDPGYWINSYINHGEPLDDAGYRTLHPFSVKDLDIPAYWPERGLKDILTEKTIPYNEIVSKNKATVIYRWASWCTFSATLLPQLRRMHEKYHDAGLEVIAYPAWGDAEGLRTQKDYLKKNGYDRWYNFSSEDISFAEEAAIGSGSMPFVNILDNQGNIIFSCSKNVSDPSRGRFGHLAFNDMIPFLEDMFGPLEDEDDYASTDYSQDGVVTTLQTATVGKGINVVFMGDAYTDRDINSGLYERLMRESMEALFSIEPYKTFRNRFNVYAVTVVSKNGKTGDKYSTALGAVISNGTTISGSTDKCFEYALKIPGIKDTKNLLVGVLVNSIHHGGVAVMIESLQSGVAFYSSYGNEQDSFGPTLRHEAGGHGFAFLADEYFTQNAAVGQEYIAESNRLFKQYGWQANIDFTNDPKNVRWNVFLSDDRYKDDVGIFEGAANCIKGAWRPSLNSMMNQNVEYFNAPSRWAIYQQIMKRSGETPDFDKFLEYDAVNRGTAAVSAARPPMKAAANSRYGHTTPPVIVR